MTGNGAAAGAGYGDMLVTSLLVLGVVCIVAFVAVRLLGRVLATGRARGAHLLNVVARVPLEPRRSLYVVEVAGKTLLVGTSEMGLNVLSELDAGEVRSRVVARPTFGELVKNAWAKRKGLAPTAAEPAVNAAALEGLTPGGQTAPGGRTSSGDVNDTNDTNGANGADDAVDAVDANNANGAVGANGANDASDAR